MQNVLTDKMQLPHAPGPFVTRSVAAITQKFYRKCIKTQERFVYNEFVC